jgi:UDP-N-acetylglucosamine 2-epimerase (non-hydrolysing)
MLDKRRILFVFGTRPEAIKMAPLIKAFEREGECFDVTVCVTGQHREMLDQVLEFFEIRPDYDLALMQKGQTLSDLTARILSAVDPVIREVKPDLVFVQGDTTTVLSAALASYYLDVPVAHLEAGLRTKDIRSPFPEEVNRVLTGHMATYHFAPTETAVRNLGRESIVKNVWNVGNTVIDALKMGLDLIKAGDEGALYAAFPSIDFSKRVVLITGHRRESFGEPFKAICRAIRSLGTKYPGVEFVYPVHLNPQVREPVGSILRGIENVHLIDPVKYSEMIWLESKCHFVLTDSGGVQEEAPSLGKPVLVMRNVTERPEGIEAGTSKLVGPDEGRIVEEATRLLEDEQEYRRMATAVNPYGDGKSSERIVGILKAELFR